MATNSVSVGGILPTDISTEQYREYRYANGGVLRISNPALLYVLANGSHRIVDDEGTTHRPTPNWLCISWKPRAGAPAFVA